MRPPCRVYLISPPRFDLKEFMADLAEALAGGDVAAFQLRLKDREDADVLKIGAALGPLVQESGAAFILNDRPDLADRLGADGVHIGQDDAPYGQARAIMGPDRIVGVTCHASRHLAMVAGEAGADYVAFGAFFPSATKEPPAQADPEILTWWQTLMEIPCVAIGGVNIDNAGMLARAGADFVAVAGAVWTDGRGPRAAVAALNAALSPAG